MFTSFPNDKYTEGLEYYLVGGAVRDHYLDIPNSDRDWLVIASTPEEMQARGFIPVGKDFPVFLHPKTKEEFALARTERKVSRGYNGFNVWTSPDVTIEEDLKRRDLTINAMALDQKEKLIDPFNGLSDLRNGHLRHVSAAFVEDPLRVLRTTRFLAKLGNLGFSICAETMSIMSQVVSADELEALPPERVWQELLRAFKLPRPDLFFEGLRQCNGLQRVLPEFDELFDNVPASSQLVDTTKLTLFESLKLAADVNDEPIIIFGVLCANLIRVSAHNDQWITSHTDIEIGIKRLTALCERLAIPNNYKNLGLMVCRHYLKVAKFSSLDPHEIYLLLKDLDGFRNTGKMFQFVVASEIYLNSLNNSSDYDNSPSDYLKKLHDRLNMIDLSDVGKLKLLPAQIGAEVQRRRVAAIAAFQYDSSTTTS